MRAVFGADKPVIWQTTHPSELTSLHCYNQDQNFRLIDPDRIKSIFNASLSSFKARGPAPIDLESRGLK
jgi:hypothetical protein